MILCGCRVDGKAGTGTGKLLRPHVEELFRAQTADMQAADDVILSVSHTGPYWFCLAGAGEKGHLGLDCELARDLPYEKIVGRWFPREEQDYVGREGRNGFLRLWTAKEALAKYTGRPLMSLLSGVCLSDGQRVLDSALGAQIREIDLSAWDADLRGTIAFDPVLRKGEDPYPLPVMLDDLPCPDGQDFLG